MEQQSQAPINVLFLGGFLPEQIIASQFSTSSFLDRMHYIPTPITSFSYDPADSNNLAVYAKKASLTSLRDIPRVMQCIQEVNPSLIMFGLPNWINAPLMQHLKLQHLPLFLLSEPAQKLNQSHTAWQKFLATRALRTPQASVFDNVDAISHYFEVNTHAFPVVAKTDRIASAKSKVCHNLSDILDFVNMTMKEADNDDIIIQQHFRGDKFIIPAIVAQNTLIVLPFCRKQVLDTTMGQYLEASFCSPQILYHKNYTALEQEILMPIVQGIQAILENYHGFLSIEVQFDRQIPYITEVNMQWDELLLLNLLGSTKIDWLELWKGLLTGTLNENRLAWQSQDSLNILVDVTTPELLNQIQSLPKDWLIGLDRSYNHSNIRMAALQITGKNLADTYRNFCEGWKQSNLSPDNFLYYKLETFWQEVHSSIGGMKLGTGKPSLPKTYSPKKYYTPQVKTLTSSLTKSLSYTPKNTQSAPQLNSSAPLSAEPTPPAPPFIEPTPQLNSSAPLSAEPTPPAPPPAEPIPPFEPNKPDDNHTSTL